MQGVCGLSLSGLFHIWVRGHWFPMLVGEFSEERVYPGKIAWTKRKDELAVLVVGGRTRMAPLRRAFRYLAWLSKSIPMLTVAVG